MKLISNQSLIAQMRLRTSNESKFSQLIILVDGRCHHDQVEKYLAIISLKFKASHPFLIDESSPSCHHCVYYWWNRKNKMKRKRRNQQCTQFVISHWTTHFIEYGILLSHTCHWNFMLKFFILGCCWMKRKIYMEIANSY